MALSITGGNGSVTGQAQTQTPQASVGPASKAAPARSVQAGTASSLLTTKSGGIALTNQQLPTVTVSGTTTGSRQSSQPEPATPVQRDVNPVLLAFAVALLVAALIIVWRINRSAKNTTN